MAVVKKTSKSSTQTSDNIEMIPESVDLHKNTALKESPKTSWGKCKWCISTPKMDKRNCFLAVILIAILSYIFLIIFGDYAVENECNNQNNVLISTSLNSSIVSETLFEYCDCVPDWMGEEGVYFEPVVTLILAILAVLAFIMIQRALPVLRSAGNWFWEKYIGKKSLKTLLNSYLWLLKGTQLQVQAALKLKYEDMPDILLKKGKNNDHNKKSENNEVNLDCETDNVMKLDGEMSQEKTDQNSNQNEKNPMGSSLDLDPSLLDIENQNKKDEEDKDIIDDDLIEWMNDKNISKEFIDWFKALDNGGDKVDEFIQLMYSTLEEYVEETDRLDNTVMFLIQLLVGIWVLIDYFAIQQWPSGGWKCKWAYFSGVVMYKSFTVPLWSCLTTACHYSFAHQLYKNRLRDPGTGTPYGSPVVRNKFTFAMICAVALMLGIWVVVTLSIALPLMVAFTPVVMLPALMVPVALFICLQKSLKAMKQLFHVDKEVEKLGDMTKPVPFVETVFVLKAATTQLISVAVLCFLFLPLYELGFSWWKEGASLFLFENFDLPSLRFRFTYSLSWPHFEQPRLGIQLALGIFLIGTHSILKITKRLLILYQELINFENIHPGYFEELVINVFSQCSWRPFRSPMDGAQTSFEAVPSLGHTRFVMWFYGYKDYFDIEDYSERPNKKKACLTECLIMTVVGIPLYVGAFCYYLFLPDNRMKHFGMGTNDQDVLDFANSEESMGYKGAQFDEGCDAKNYSVLAYRCPWLRVSRFDGKSLLHLLANEDDDKALEAVLSMRSHDVNQADKYGQLPIHIAAMSGYEKFLEVLISAGSKLDIATYGGRLPIHIAAMSGYEKCLEVLISAGSKLDIADYDGQLPIHCAAENGSEKCLEVLISAGSKLDIANNDGKTALDLAREKGEEKSVELLEAASQANKS